MLDAVAAAAACGGVLLPFRCAPRSDARLLYSPLVARCHFELLPLLAARFRSSLTALHCLLFLTP